MIPMFRTLASSVAVLMAATVITLVPCSKSVCKNLCSLQAVVGECLVGLGHLVRVLTPLDARAETVAGIEQLVHEPLGHGLFPAGPARGDPTEQCVRGAACRPHLARHLVGRATNSAAADLKGRLDVVERALQRDDRVVARLVAAAFERAVDNAL